MLDGAVRRTLARWEESGLLGEELAGRLRAELAEHAERERVRFSRLLLAATAAVVLVIAAVTFTAWIWPDLGVGARCLVLGGLGLGLLVSGARLERAARREVGGLLQTTGLVLIALACGYSAERWEAGTPIGILTGVLALLTGLGSFLYFVRRSPVMSAISVLLSFLFALVFLIRAFAGDSGDALIWSLDGLFLLESVLVLAALRSRWAPAWTPAAAGLLVGFMPVLIAATVVGPLGYGGSALAWPLDAWLLGVTALLLHLRRTGAVVRPIGLALCVLIAIPLAFHTTLNAARATPEAAAVVVAGIGALALAFALPRGERETLLAGAATLVVAAWYYAVERGEAMSAFLALGFTAAILFWVATRVGRGRPSDRA